MGVAEEEVWVTAEVVAVPETAAEVVSTVLLPEASLEVLYMVVLVSSTERLLVEEMVLFPEEVDAMEEELENWAEAVPMRATAIVTNVFFIV